MSNLNFDVCLTHLYKILAKIYAFKLKVGFLEGAKNCLKWSINLHYGNKLVKTRNSKLSLKALDISANILWRCLRHTSKFKLDITVFNILYLNKMAPLVF